MTGLSQIGGTIAFHVLSAAFVSAASCAVLGRMAGGVHRKVVYAFMLLIFMAFWAEDAGRTDMAVAGCIAMATLQLLKHRAVPAALWLTVGLLFHENGFIFGLPLMLVLCFLEPRAVRLAPRSLQLAGALIVLVCVAYLLIDHLPHADAATMAASVRSRLPSHITVDWAIYFAISGTRGVKTSICQSWVANPNYFLHLVSGLIVITLATFILAGRDRRIWRQALCAALPPFLFLFVVANDMARWSTLACFNAWLVAGAHPSEPRWARAPVFVLHVACACALLVLTHPKHPLSIAIPIYSPSPFIEALSIRAGGPLTLSVSIALDRCDPDWREVVTGQVK
jgi:4-amino-4-deoxy-L-arabinose transferase-like glycosyltransferase